MRSRLLCLAATFGIVSCGDSDKDTSLTAVETARLSPDDLAAPSSLPSLPSVHVKSKIDESKAMSNDLGMQTATLTDTDTDSDRDLSVAGLNTVAESESVESCVQGLIDSIRMKASVDTVVVDEILDYSSCLALSPGNGGGTYTVQSATISLFVQVSCANGDYSPADGKTMAEAESLIPAECASTFSYLSNSTIRTLASLEENGVVAPIDTLVIESEGEADNTPCQAVLAEGLRTEDNCVSVSKEIDYTTPANNYFQKMVSRKLTWSDGQAGDYFASGDLDVTVNDWTGVVSFGGQTTAPTYSMSNGAETLAGSLDARPLELFARVKKSLAAKIAHTFGR